MALSATRSDILKLVFLMVAKVAALGLAIGLCGSVALARIVRSQMDAKASFSAGSLAMVVIVMAGVAALAAWLPAARAGNLDPVTALRHET
jgi:ABC-type antimicrobial peptide transport system permease subunit